MLMVTVRAKEHQDRPEARKHRPISFRAWSARRTSSTTFDSKRDCGFIPDDLDADLFPGGTAEGNVCFKVPAEETGFVLVWQEFFGDTLTYFALE
jgi:hypothetical protein